MKTLFRSLVAIALLVVALLAAPAAYAQSGPCGSPVFKGHASSFFKFGKLVGLRACGPTFPAPDCDYVTFGTVSVLGEPNVQSGNVTDFCTVASPAESSGGPCQPQAGTALDGKLTINGDWSSPAGTGCPAAVSTGANGGSPNVAFITVTGRDPSGAPLGLYLLSSVGYLSANGSYLFDLSQPPNGSNFDPIPEDALAPIPSPIIQRPGFLVHGALADFDIKLRVSRIKSYDDCTTGGNIQGTCAPPDQVNVPRPVLEGSVLYRADLPCGTRP